MRPKGLPFYVLIFENQKFEIYNKGITSIRKENNDVLLLRNK